MGSVARNTGAGHRQWDIPDLEHELFNRTSDENLGLYPSGECMPAAGEC